MVRQFHEGMQTRVFGNHAVKRLQVVTVCIHQRPTTVHTEGWIFKKSEKTLSEDKGIA